MDKRTAIQKYFQPFPKWAVWTFIGGILITTTFPIAGISLIAFSGLIIFLYYKGMPKDHEIDQFIAEDLLAAKSKSLQKAGIDESELMGESVFVTGFTWEFGLNYLYKKGEDNVLRFSPITIHYLHMLENQLLSYQAALDLTTGNFLNESTDEYFYQDVVSIATKTESISYTNSQGETEQHNNVEIFELTTSGGTKVRTVLKDPKAIANMGGGFMPTTEAERAIQVVRRMLRDKKKTPSYERKD